ncbi:hypothetical protein B0H34DRAFT_802591 [Crassisporium funariophilum]|nr:hypothetical protein B0H34DRAFT_802591 [Crassisporium funariophilum]
MPGLTDGTPPPTAQLPKLFKLLLTAALNIFQGEQQRLQVGGAEMVPLLINEFVAYAYNKEPFKSHMWSRGTKPLKWWTEISHDSNARLISQIAIKLFSISPSEICDERTASRLGWYNAARRSSITPEHLIDSTKLYDFYMNGFDEGKYTHTARVHLKPVNPGSTSSTNPHVRSAPSLMDLVNADDIEPASVDIAAEEQQLFNHPDPYDLAETDRVDGALMPTMVTIRSSLSFDITEYIKFDDPKLAALIMKVDEDGPGAALTPMEVQPQQTKAVGKPGEWSVDSFVDCM